MRTYQSRQRRFPVRRDLPHFFHQFVVQRQRNVHASPIIRDSLPIIREGFVPRKPSPPLRRHSPLSSTISAPSRCRSLFVQTQLLARNSRHLHLKFRFSNFAFPRHLTRVK